MKERDKGWTQSTKLQIIGACGLCLLGIYIDPRNTEVVRNHIVSIIEAIVIACAGGRVGMQVTESIVEAVTNSTQTIIQKVDPKDVDGLPE